VAEDLVEVKAKPFWASKTLWVNALVGVAALAFPDLLGKILTEANVIMLITVVNVILRAFSTDSNLVIS